MQLIGFNLNKINAEKKPDFTLGPVNTNIEFLNVEKEEFKELKENYVVKVLFTFSVNYSEKDNSEKDNANVTMEGVLVLSTNKEESDEFSESWKDKKLPDKLRLPIVNALLRKCSVRAFTLEEDLNLPPHMPLDVRPS